MGLNSKSLLKIQQVRGRKAIAQYITKCIDLKNAHHNFFKLMDDKVNPLYFLDSIGLRQEQISKRQMRLTTLLVASKTSPSL